MCQNYTNSHTSAISSYVFFFHSFDVAQVEGIPKQDLALVVATSLKKTVKNSFKV